MGHVNRLPCTIRNREIVIGGLHLPAPEYQEVVDDFAVAFVRPHDLVLSPVPVDGGVVASTPSVRQPSSPGWRS